MAEAKSQRQDGRTLQLGEKMPAGLGRRAEPGRSGGERHRVMCRPTGAFPTPADSGLGIGRNTER